MAIADNELDQIVEADLLALIADVEVERRTLEFKSGFSPRTDAEKKEFLYDVSSFANAAGGHLVYGVQTTAGRPTALLGMTLSDPDAEILAWESIARDGIRPPVNLESKAVPLASGNVAVVMRIARSWNPPHQVTYNKAFRFYGRGSNGKYLLEVEELRSIFSLSRNAVERIRDFRVERLAKIHARDTPAPIGPGPKLVSHILPLAAFQTTSTFDLRLIERDLGKLVPIIGGVSGARYNLDGYVGSSNGRYVQVFRNACIEVVQEYGDPQARIGYQALPSTNVEDKILQHIAGSKRLLREAGIEPPVVIACSILGAKGWELALDYQRTHAFDREAVILPEEVLTTLGDPHRPDARPIIDTLWQAVGVARSPNFDLGGDDTDQ